MSGSKSRGKADTLDERAKDADYFVPIPLVTSKPMMLTRSGQVFTSLFCTFVFSLAAGMSYDAGMLGSATACGCLAALGLIGALLSYLEVD